MKSTLGHDEFRERISLLGLKSSFPRSIDKSSPYSSRCILELENAKSTPSSSLALRTDGDIEDLVVTLMRIKDEDKIISRSVQEILSTLFSYVPMLRSVDSTGIVPFKKGTIHRLYNSLHPGIAETYKYVEINDDIILLNEFTKHSLLSASRFQVSTRLSSRTFGRASGAGAKDLRLRFIIYQLLQVVSFIHRQGLVLDPLTPENIMLDDDMWLTIPVGISKRACFAASIKSENKVRQHGNEYTQDPVVPDTPNSVDVPSRSLDNNEYQILSLQPSIDYYVPLTVQWTTRKISNFEYLLALNYAAGRSMIDPLYHPIIPWVTDFTREHPTLQSNRSGGRETRGGGLRDLSKTKFRLMKGDAQQNKI